MDTFFMTEAFDNFTDYLDNSELALEMSKSQFEQDLCAMEVAVMTENASNDDLDSFYEEASEGFGAKVKASIKKIIDRLVSLCNRVHNAISEKFSKAKMKKLKDDVGNNSTKVSIEDGKALDSLEDETVSKLDKLKAKLKKNPDSVSEEDINQVADEYEAKRKKIKGATIAVTATAAVTVLSVLSAKFIGKTKRKTTIKVEDFVPTNIPKLNIGSDTPYSKYVEGRKNKGANAARGNAKAQTKWHLLASVFSRVSSESANDQQSWMNKVQSKLSSVAKGAINGAKDHAHNASGKIKIAAREHQRGTRNGYRPLF